MCPAVLGVTRDHGVLAGVGTVQPTGPLATESRQPKHPRLGQAIFNLVEKEPLGGP